MARPDAGSWRAKIKRSVCWFCSIGRYLLSSCRIFAAAGAHVAEDEIRASYIDVRSLEFSLYLRSVAS